MIIEYLTTISLRCPVCGRLDVHPINIFDFSGQRSKEIYCSCGYRKVKLETKNYKRYWVQFNCIICELEHTLFFTPSAFWGSKLLTIRCPDTDLKLGYLGPEILVQGEIQDQQQDLEAMIKDLGFDDYFCDPEVMLGVLDILHDIAEAGGLFCQCGNKNIDIDMYPDKIELVCRECQGMTMIKARTIADLEQLKETNKVILTKGKNTALQNDPS
ncbi:hypothetical protein BBF96_11915 [Anoxybacter fermentans]|uniref:CpXC domain-containing protein n=1 Tax=Anoxybacter fermentans TaxID=1323375 RepID=A0A3Q9HRC7_9FIRM|nr:hypothetical protein [Anoxybacter fermentans]AZR74037.1 hypothetical protein BBF96_11915 [Anoxybacter fermentans]